MVRLLIPQRSLFSQPSEAQLRFPNRGPIANIDSLCDDAQRLRDGAGFCSGPAHRIDCPVCPEEVSMAVSRQHRVDDGKIRGGITKVDISPINHTGKFVCIVGDQDLTAMQVAVDKRVT